MHEGSELVLICFSGLSLLAGWDRPLELMRRYQPVEWMGLKGGVLREFPNRVLNIHPSLLPSFPGLAAWKQALEYGVKVTGCTVHIVDQGIDTGPILGQQAVEILPDDTAESLHVRIQEQEHKLAVRILQRISDGEIAIG